MENPISIITKLNKAKNVKYFLDTQNNSLIVIGNVNLSGLELRELPVKFSVISGTFDCSNNLIDNLSNCPQVGETGVIDHPIPE